jgi:hypothetical protein
LAFFESKASLILETFATDLIPDAQTKESKGLVNLASATLLVARQSCWARVALEWPRKGLAPELPRASVPRLLSLAASRVRTF